MFTSVNYNIFIQINVNDIRIKNMVFELIELSNF